MKTFDSTFAPVYKLPNGLSIYHHNAYETDFVYNEIFKQKIYLKHGITLNKDACVFDVGANIGLFSLFVKKHCPNAIIYAFEPSPENCKLLTANLKIEQDSAIHIFQQGLSNKEGNETFTYYPGYSIISGFHANAEDDKLLLSAGIKNQLQQQAPEGEEVPEKYIDLTLGNKLDAAIQFECPLTTLSSIIDNEKIKRIDLLKIDAEKSELDILAGIDENDWGKIQQIVMESHHKEESEFVENLLKEKGFKTHIELEAQFKGTSVYNHYALRLN